MYLCRVVTLRYCMDVTVPFDPGAAGLVLVQASPELTSNMSFPFYKPVWTSTESLYLHSLYLYSRFLYSIHHSQSSQSISIYDRGIGAKISVSISISRFLRLENLLYTNTPRHFRFWAAMYSASATAMNSGATSPSGLRPSLGRKEDGTGLRPELVLRRRLSAAGHASGCPKPRPAFPSATGPR